MRFSLPLFSRCWPKPPISAATFSIVFSGLAILAFSSDSRAQTLPDAADIGRIPTTPERPIPNAAPQNDNILPVIAAPTVMPEGAKQVHLDLKDIRIEGASAFSEGQLLRIYVQYLDKDVTLDVIYDVAAKITALYKESGYFLSVAYVPDQKIKDGIVHIKVIERYVESVESDDQKISQMFIVQSYIADLKKHKPLKSDSMESFLLRINDLPGYMFRAILSPAAGVKDGAVKITLVPASKEGQGFVGFDNFSSRFMGPNQFSASYEKSLISLQQTSISGVVGTPADKLKYVTLGQSIVIVPALKLNLNANVTRSQPGYTLEPLDVKSKSNYLGVGLEWQYIRQRTENASFSMLLDSHNTSIDFLNTPFTRDHVRSLRIKANYDGDWGGNGYNWAEFTLSRGLSILGASELGDDNLSREQAKPNFTKAEMLLTRFQSLPQDFSMVISLAGQLASGPLYSSEEFGYGGQSFGRAYDPSEITGDHGVSGAIEIQYSGMKTGENFKVSPYVFYDVGAVWNDDDGQPKRQSGASSGVGMRLHAPMDVSFNIGLALPLTRRIESPVYGGQHSGPRLFLQLSKKF